ncbi:short-chain dehydrogenase [Pontibacillus halophilus JSM 076056 = DSM 19796]|uniref:Short-chain dehydrogenase n=1 Tax=Pontibacillus halophilus JSM 076056 = DSM 19796 TaxID=1385510 RepID=A0A0A5GM93_9BACI|nr:SDR family oxidoreductase [Pontibacillus halophilus]KGX92348.1 short-chain dehydrogenase [Pontibacillus halophilus JSM 076056 = DSM 19796]
MARLEGKVAIVTGAATGIGQATAELFAKEGAVVICADVDEEKVNKTVQSIKDEGGTAEAQYLDVSSEEVVKEFAEEVKKKHGAVDVLFNNAGVDEEGGKVHEYPMELFDKILSVDLRGTFMTSKYIIPLMLEHGGSIINVSSMSGRAADLDRSGYNAAKGGIINLTKAMAIDYGRQGIRANSIAPGTIETPLVDKLAGSKEEDEGQQFREAQEWVTPMGRLGQPNEMAKVALFLASDDSSFVTGEDILADGGLQAYTWPGKMLFEKGWK